LSDNALYDGIRPERGHIGCTGFQNVGRLEFFLGSGVSVLASQLEKGILPTRGRTDREVCGTGDYDMVIILWEGDAHPE